MSSDVTCPRCNTQVPRGSAFCSECGRPMRAPRAPVKAQPRVRTRGRASASQETAPVAAVQASPRSAKPAASAGQRRAAAARQPARAPWYQRKMVVVPLSILLLLVTVVSAGAWYVTSQLASLGDLSTPPPEVSLDELGGEDGVKVDTSAAQEQVEQADTSNLTQGGEGSVTALMMGVDARPGEPIDIEVRADSLAVVHVDADTDQCRMLSIPRDTRVELPGYGYSKINHALMIGGVPYQQLVVELYLGVDIDHYGLIDFAGLSQLVNSLGGITVQNVNYAFEQGEHRFPIGTLELSGWEALSYSRYREGPDGDFGRQERQQQVLRALLDKGVSLDLITAVPDFLDMLDGHVRTDLDAREMVDMGQSYRSVCTSENLETASLDGWITDDWDEVSGTTLSFVYIEEAEIERKVDWLLGGQVSG